jgi:hypothetical protein
VASSFGVCFRDFEMINFLLQLNYLLHRNRSTHGDPETKKAIEIISMAESIIDEVVNKLLNEIVEKVLKED